MWFEKIFINKIQEDLEGLNVIFVRNVEECIQYLKGEMRKEQGEREQWVMADGSVWDIIVTGVGAINVMHTLRDLPRNAKIINIGYAGSANYAIGSAVCVKEVRLNHPCVSYPEPELHLQVLPAGYMQKVEEVIESVCYSNTDFVLQSDYRDCVFDMELAYIAALGFENLCSIKIVSDNLSLHTYREVAAGVDEA